MKPTRNRDDEWRRSDGDQQDALPIAGRYVQPPDWKGWDDDKLTLVSAFCWPSEGADEDPAVAQADQDPGRVAARLLGFLTLGQTSAEEIGRRTVLLAYLVKAPGVADSQRELGAFLGVSGPRVNALLRRLRAEMRKLSAGG